ncbi:MAG: agmatinase [Candidatus Cloacimonadia bacterium]
MTGFLEFYSDFEDAEIVFRGIPYDGTVTFRPGTRFAPDATRVASHGLEGYSPYQDKNIRDYPICDYGDVFLPFGNTERIMDLIEADAKEIISTGKKLLSCGGEHLVSFPLIKAHLEKYPELKIIHFDAHTDLRDKYLGEKLSHATVFRRVCEYTSPKNLYQFGMRCGRKEEFIWGRENTNFYPFTLDQFAEAIKAIPKDTPVYITLDVDVLDPSFFPGTGTPEPGGVTFHELHNSLLLLQDYNIVGADIVELAPDYDPSGVSSITTAKLVRELALLLT